jgi:hypothetical protein
MSYAARQRTVFISATTSGFEEWRQILKNIVVAHHWQPDEMGAFVPGTEDLVQKLGNKIHAADGVMCLVGPYYGSKSPVTEWVYVTPEFKAKWDGYPFSYTQLELLLAVHMKKPCLKFVAKETFFEKIKPPKTEEDEQMKQCQREFIDEVKKMGQEDIFVRDVYTGGYLSVHRERDLAIELAKMDWDPWFERRGLR